MQSLAFTMRDFATVRDFEAARAKLRDNLRAALDFDTGETTMMHTPGPWVVDPKTLAVYAPDRHSCSAAEIRANVALVAAAPDLLAALQWTLSQIEDSLDPDHRAALESARAIARATGGQ